MSRAMTIDVAAELAALRRDLEAQKQYAVDAIKALGRERDAYKREALAARTFLDQPAEGEPDYHHDHYESVLDSYEIARNANEEAGL